MTKLKLSDFLINDINKPQISFETIKDIVSEFSYSLPEFYQQIIEHNGIYIINNIPYTYIIPSTTSLYFYNEESAYDCLIAFDPLIDIKQKTTGFTLFYYPDQIINIELKGLNEQKGKISKDVKG